MSKIINKSSFNLYRLTTLIQTINKLIITSIYKNIIYQNQVNTLSTYYRLTISLLKQQSSKQKKQARD